VNQEEEFHKILDENPDDCLTRMVLSDWLEEMGDARAEGYMVIGGMNLLPEHNPTMCAGCNINNPLGCWSWWCQTELTRNYEENLIGAIPQEWFDLIESKHTYSEQKTREVEGKSSKIMVCLSKDFLTRRGSEDAAALAWSLLPEKTKEKIRKIYPEASWVKIL